MKNRIISLLALAAVLVASPLALAGNAVNNPPGSAGGAVSSVSGSSGITCSPTTGVVVCTNNLITGLAGGQTVIGGTAASEGITFSSTSNATKGAFTFGSSSLVVINEAVTTATGTVLNVGGGSTGITEPVKFSVNGAGTYITVMQNLNTGTVGQAALGVYNSSLDGVSLVMHGTGFTTSGLRAANVAMLNQRRAANMVYSIFAATGDHVFATTTSITERLRITTAGALQVGAPMMTANGSVATALTAVGPAGANTTVQEWFTITNAAGTVRYIPAF